MVHIEYRCLFARTKTDQLDKKAPDACLKKGCDGRFIDRIPMKALACKYFVLADAIAKPDIEEAV